MLHSMQEAKPNPLIQKSQVVHAWNDKDLPDLIKISDEL